MSRIPRKLTARLCGSVVLASLCGPAAFAIHPEENEAAHRRSGPGEVSSRILEVRPSLEIYPQSGKRGLADLPMQSFFAEYSDRWEVRWDVRSHRPHLIQGAGVPILPGRGNDLRTLSPGRGTGQDLDLDGVAELLRRFLDERPNLLRVDGLDLELDRERSLVYGEEGHFWSVEFRQSHGGIPVENAFVFFRINHGNIVQLGSHRVAEVALDPRPALSRQEALGVALGHAGLQALEISEKAASPGLKIVPVMADGEPVGEPFVGVAGGGYRHRLVWDLHYDAGGTTYGILVDAHGGELLRHRDLSVFLEESSGAEQGRKAHVRGDIYPRTNSQPLTKVGLPYTRVTTREQGEAPQVHITSGDGGYEYPGGTATAALDGRYVRINSSCGGISLSDDLLGNLDFGGAGTGVCDAALAGGAGNTNASRTTFVHATEINRYAKAFLPGVSWLDGTLSANVDQPTVCGFTCNACWDGTAVNFARKVSGCSNTGQIADIVYHEWGHGMDTNTGGTPSERGSGEAVADTFSFLLTRDGCIGPNFRPGQPCHNCRSSCTGVRDIESYVIGGPRPIARPDRVTDPNGLDCSCHPSYFGPMGFQGHCESQIASTANWDLAQAIGWSAFEEIWFGSLFPSKSAYRVVSGGSCNPRARVDGCGAQNWYTVYLAVDDDDGNLSNGTPNGCAIWDAFDAHGIACGSRPPCGPVDEPPTASFTATCNDLTCSFDGSASTDDHGITQYRWDFGDGFEGSGRFINHTYAAAGRYTATLTVLDTAGQLDSESQPVEPTDPPPLCEVTSFQVSSFATGLPVVSWTTTCPTGGVVSVQVKTTTLSSLPAECRLSGALWDGNKNGSRTADYMAGGYGPSSSCPAVERARFWVELRDTSNGDELIGSTAPQTAVYNPPPLPCEILSFSITNGGTGQLPVISWTTSCPDPGPVSVQVKTTTISQQPAGCALDAALWDGNKNGSRPASFMAGGYGADCPPVTHARFWVELWDATQLLQRTDFRDAFYTP